MSIYHSSTGVSTGVPTNAPGIHFDDADMGEASGDLQMALWGIVGQRFVARMPVAAAAHTQFAGRGGAS